MKSAEEIQKELKDESPKIQVLTLQQWEIEIRMDQTEKDHESTQKIINEVFKKQNQCQKKPQSPKSIKMISR